uniref:Angiopoietin like 4 n=2 Tax=Pan TaxID=9596 RepID=A0A2I3SIV8_PANTR
MSGAPTAGAALMLCAATAVLLSAQGGPVQSKSPRFASWDEMNVLAHGLLQLGQGLREHAERTRSQLSALERRLSACGSFTACRYVHNSRLRTAGSSNSSTRWPSSSGTWRSSTCEFSICKASLASWTTST